MFLRIREFFRGRYGVDQLSIALVIVSFVVNLIFSIVYPKWYIHLIVYIPLFLALLRILSRNFSKRQSENEKFMRIYYPIKGKFMLFVNFCGKKINQIKDKSHKYYKCPKCKRTLRVPKGKGKIKINCPHCGKIFIKNTGKNKSI